MKSPHTDKVHHLADRAKKSLSQTARNSRSSGRSTTGLARIGLLIISGALAITALSVPSFRRLSPNQLPNSAPSALSDARNGTSATANNNHLSAAPRLAERNRSQALPLPAAWLLPPLPLPPPSEPTVSFFESDCSTPRTIFHPGDTVCARIDGLNTSLFSTHFDWSNPDHEVKARSTNITADGQTRSFTLASNASVGGWNANITDQTGTIRAVGGFTVSDAADPAVDLSLNDDGPATATADTDVNYKVVLYNYGPDAAPSVVLTLPIPANTTYASIAQNEGPVFTCEGGATDTTCTIASFAANEVAIFSVTYHVVSGTANDTVVTSTAIASHDTGTGMPRERNAEDNQASAETKVTAVACVVSCPSNITVQADSGQAGAFVTFPAPTSSGSCGASPISCSSQSGDFFPVGTTPVTCTGDTGNACTFTVTVENPGSLSISLNGTNPMTAECGAVLPGSNEPPQGFSDPGATAVNGNGDSVPVTITGSVDLTMTGPYTLTYTATEGSNSVSTTRTVNVIDTTAPAITIDGANPYRIQQGSCQPFVDPGASATDGCSGPVGVTRTISGPGGLTMVDNNTPGTYTVTYSATDGTHSATATRTVLVGNFPPGETDEPDNPTPPTITLIGDDQMTIECGSNFTDPGATATACGGSVPVTTSGTVDTHTPGVYTITYSATNSGGTAETNRTVTVMDTSAPIITLNGANPLQVECHTSFTDPGATADDACAGSVPVTASGTVDPNTPGTYTITYTATDGSHAATPVTRTVNVVDTQGPVITINGPNPATVECHTSYTDAGATAFDACLNSSTPVTTSGSVDVNATGTYTITYTSSDGVRTSTATRTVNVVDTIPPVITLKTTPITLWPPNHSYHTVNVSDMVQSVTDSCGGDLGLGSVVIASVTSDETENGEGDGNTTNDIVIASDCKTVQLRSERSGNRDGRVYSITVRARDAAGNASTAVFKVTVPKTQSSGAAVDSGPHYTVNGTCP